MTDSISARLRSYSIPIQIEAADHIDTQAATIKALMVALGPFSEAAEIKLCGGWRNDESIQKTDVAFHIKFGDLRRARAAIAAMPDTKAIVAATKAEGLE